MRAVEITQTLIHKLEEGGGQRYLRYVMLVLAALVIWLRYDFHAYKNMNTQEGMDAAQLARNISEGKGYTTQFIRPFDLYLVQRHNQAAGAAFSTNAMLPDFARLRGNAHPDISNPPVYPVVLAAVMKILPFHYAAQTGESFWNDSGRFSIDEPDFLIALFNQILFFGGIALTYFIARKLFDVRVAGMTAGLMFLCNLLWQFSVSGISTMLLLDIFLALVWCILKTEEAAREPQPDENRLLRLAVAAGILTGVGALTRYAFGWIIIPVAIFFVLFGGRRRAIHTVAAVGAFLVLLTPWVIRNYAISGTPFGTAGYAVLEDTFLFPKFNLERSLHPNFTGIFGLTPYRHKLWENGTNILINQLPTLGGSIASLLFLPGLLLQFRSVAVRRMRYFLLMSLGIIVIVQALGQTYLTTESPAINSENLLVLLLPLIFIYGVSLFFTLLDQMSLPVMQLRYVVVAGFVLLSCLPMKILLWTSTSPVAYPPYYPPEIQQTSSWLKEGELEMSDIPWAVAWYGHHQCVWLSLDTQKEFYAINDEIKPVHALYLTTETTDGKFLSDFGFNVPENMSWGKFVVDALVKKQIPGDFPFKYAPPFKMLPERLFLADSEYWKFPGRTTKPL